MRKKQKNGIEWLEFELLANQPNLAHGIFLRSGGFSTGHFASLNLSYIVGDDPNTVKSNLDHAVKTLDIPGYAIMQQCHGCSVIEVDSSLTEPQKNDAMTTTKLGVGLMVTHADCQATIFYDPVRRAVANVHSGWRGSVQNIYAETIAFMQKKYQSQPKDLLVCISPSLGPDDAEFVNYRTELPEAFWEFQVRPNYFDFWSISRMQLKQLGVLDQHIEIAGISTRSDTDFFSYRRDKVTGRNGTIVALM